MITRTKKKVFVAGAALAMTLGLSACHHWRGHDDGHRYYGPSHSRDYHRDRGRDDGGYDRRDRRDRRY